MGILFAVGLVWFVISKIVGPRKRPLPRFTRDLDRGQRPDNQWVHFTDDNRFYDERGSHYVHGRDEHRYYDETGSHYYHDRD